MASPACRSRDTTTRKFARSILLALPCWCAVPVSAQGTFRSAGSELGHVFADVGYLWSSPFRASSGDWTNAAIAAGAFGALMRLDGRIDRWIVGHPRATVIEVLAPFREADGPFTRLATARQLLPISAALALAGTVTDRRGMRDAGLGCIAGWGFSNTLRYAIYAGVSRDRPSLAGGDQYRISIPGGDWNQNSFFAGHATNAFACASFWSTRFDLGPGEPVLYATAALSALSRMADRRHWASDTFVGIVVGIAVGRTIAGRQARREATQRGDAGDTPQIATRHTGLAARAPVVILWRIDF
jgi:membrane-associated phospholipid phosphatase